MKKLTCSLSGIVLLVCTHAVSAQGYYDQSRWGAETWSSGPGISTAFYIEQRQWPAGYGIRLYVPPRRTADIRVKVEGNRLVISSEEEGRLQPRGAQGPVFVQFGSFSQWLTLPADADLSQMKLTSRGGVIDIFVPRRR